ncbi:MAG: hypothetical protein ACREX3_09465 [Gammaproteobacteria bacterium]
MNRAAYEELARARMKDIYATMDEYRTKAADPDVPPGMSAQKAPSELEHRCDRAGKHLQDLCECDDECWENMRSGFDGVLNELESSTNTALERNVIRLNRFGIPKIDEF